MATISGAGQELVRVAIAVVRREQEVLVGIRPAEVPLAGLAEFPGGKCQARETPEQTAVRECLEETGLRVRACRRLCEVEHIYPHGRLHLTFVECEPLCLDPPQAPFRWTAIGQLRQLQFPEANKLVLEILEQEALDSEGASVMAKRREAHGDRAGDCLDYDGSLH
ncbi:8-oxo-dGTP diphosphatase [bacterium HR36]|nr:8-oxo-dGTP diphosphatase [bacterium HR36]